MNYYTRSLIAADPAIAWPSLRPVPGELPKTQMGWEIFPDGLHHFLTRMARDYVGQMPIYRHRKRYGLARRGGKRRGL